MDSSPIDLPDPSGYDPDGTPWWRLSDGERVYAALDSVYGPGGQRELDNIEADALAHLAAVAYARGAQHNPTDSPAHTSPSGRAGQQENTEQRSTE